MFDVFESFLPFLSLNRNSSAFQPGLQFYDRLLARPEFRSIFYKDDGKGGWRVPNINESCCIRTTLAVLLDAIATQVWHTSCITYLAPRGSVRGCLWLCSITTRLFWWLQVLWCREQGPDALYEQHAEDLAREVQAAGGIITAQDIRSAAPIMKDPLTIQACWLRPNPPPNPAISCNRHAVNAVTRSSRANLQKASCLGISA
jgi:gamma-glutamyltranspeptidase/glutathione hydrolase/leukotriene-C4 hydrolase